MKKAVLFLSCIFLFFSSCASGAGYLRSIRLSKVEDYLYEVYYDGYNYDSAEKLFRKNRVKISRAGCSAIRNLTLLGRNFDWFYDDTAEYIVRTPASNGRHATIGVACGTENLTEKLADSRKYHKDYKVLPFLIVDGINDAGVVCCMNHVFNDSYGITTSTNRKGKFLYAPMIVRYVLDYADSADEALELIRERNIYSALEKNDTHEFHFMIADSEKTYIVELINNEIRVLENATVMTNFFLDHIYERENVMGYERYMLLKDNYKVANTKRGMINLLKKVYYSNAYNLNTDPFWYSEYLTNWGRFKKVGKSGTFTNQDYMDILLRQRNSIRSAGRAKAKEHDNALWHTAHMSVYDIYDKTLTIIAQENNKEFERTL